MCFYLSRKSWLANESELWVKSSKLICWITFPSMRDGTVKGQREKARLGKSLGTNLFCCDWKGNDYTVDRLWVLSHAPAVLESALGPNPSLALRAIGSAAATHWQHGLCHHLHGLGGRGETEACVCKQLSRSCPSAQKPGRGVCKYILDSERVPFDVNSTLLTYLRPHSLPSDWMAPKWLIE